MAESRSGRPKRKPSDRYHHGDLRQALVDAALALVDHAGTGALSLSAAARRAGVSPQASYNHFRDKGELLAAAAESAVRAVTREMERARDRENRPGERLEAAGLAYVRFAEQHAAQFRLLGAPELTNKTQHPGLAAAYEAAFALLVECVAECQRAGLVRSGSAKQIAVSAWATVHGIASMVADGLLLAAHIEGEPADVTKRAMRALFSGLRSPTSDARQR